MPLWHCVYSADALHNTHSPECLGYLCSDIRCSSASCTVTVYNIFWQKSVFQQCCTCYAGCCKLPVSSYSLYRFVIIVRKARPQILNSLLSQLICAACRYQFVHIKTNKLVKNICFTLRAGSVSKGFFSPTSVPAWFVFAEANPELRPTAQRVTAIYVLIGNYDR